MSEHSAASSLWNRARQIIRPLGLPALPGWLLLAFELAEKVHLVNSIVEHTWIAGVLREWGWLVGAGWLVLVVLLEARKPPRDEDLRRARKMKDLGAATVDVICRFEALCLAYEGQEPAVSLSGRRHELLLALESLLRDGLNVMPAAQRAEFEHMLQGVVWDYSQYHERDPRTRFADELPPTLAIRRVAYPPAQQQAVADAPSPTASG